MQDSSIQPSSDMVNKTKDAQLTLQKDIRAKWDKFSEIEVGALKSEDDLVTQLVAKYDFDKPKAESEAKALVKGRSF